MSLTDKSPLISVIICVYNAGAFLAESVQSILSQTYKNLEILIVDDGSTDGCFESIAEFSDSRIRILRQENRGKPSAMNRALDHAKGEFYAIQDADDVSHPRRMEIQLRGMQENPDLAAIFCGYELLVRGRRTAPYSKFKSREECRRSIAAFRMPSHDPTAMYRMTFVGGERYDPKLRLGEGLDYILRIGEKYPMLVLIDFLYAYRIHGGSITKREIDRRQMYVSLVLQAGCARRGISFEERFPQFVVRSVKRGNKELDNNLAAHFIESACTLVLSGNRRRAIQVGIDCILQHPFDPHYYKALIYAASPSTILKKRSENEP